MAKFIKLIKDFDEINISLKKQEAIKGAPKRIKGIKQLQLHTINKSTQANE
jgi:hypothetical protein